MTKPKRIGILSSTNSGTSEPAVAARISIHYKISNLKDIYWSINQPDKKTAILNSLKNQILKESRTEEFVAPSTVIDKVAYIWHLRNIGQATDQDLAKATKMMLDHLEKHPYSLIIIPSSSDHNVIGEYAKLLTLTTIANVFNIKTITDQLEPQLTQEIKNAIETNE